MKIIKTNKRIMMTLILKKTRLKKTLTVIKQISRSQIIQPTIQNNKNKIPINNKLKKKLYKIKIQIYKVNKKFKKNKVPFQIVMKV